MCVFKGFSPRITNVKSFTVRASQFMLWVRQYVQRFANCVHQKTEVGAAGVRWHSAHVVGGDRRSTRFDFRKRKYCRTLNQLCAVWDARNRIIKILYTILIRSIVQRPGPALVRKRQKKGPRNIIR